MTETNESSKQRQNVDDVRNQEAFTILRKLEGEGTISPEKCEAYKQKFIQLHSAFLTNFENEKELMKKARKLQKSLNNEGLKLEKAQQQQKEHEYKLRALEERLETVKKETAEIEERNQLLQSDISRLENKKNEQESDFAMQEQQKKELLEPEIEAMRKRVAEMKQSLVEGKDQIKKEEDTTKKHEETLTDLDGKKTELSDDIEKLKVRYYKERDEPIRQGKIKAKIEEEAVQHLKEQLDQILEESKEQEGVLKREKKTLETLENMINVKREESKTKQPEIKDLDAQIYEVSQEIKNFEELEKELSQTNAEDTMRIKDLQASKKSQQDMLKKIQKEINMENKKCKGAQHDNDGIVIQMKDLETNIAGTTKFTEELKKDEEKYKNSMKNLHEEQQIFVGQLVKLGLDEKKMTIKTTKLQNDIQECEKQVQDYQAEENKWIEEIKFLSTIREKMARTASAAAAKKRETEEELKVKELLILDLTKKQQETEFRLNSFLALYEEMKNARNKFVSQIQCSSQDLAEMKERIKILQNEVEIMRNESSEKDRALTDIRQNVQKEIYKRDAARAELNKFEFTFRSKLSIINQRINEGDKLNLIINQLQKEMNNLIYEYEQACESRNYMGIQLIDRNDELCILYEKSNIQENILKNGEQKIREKEEKIRMINLELKERQRQLQVVRKQIPEVPALAESVIDLKKKLDNEKEKVGQLSEQLENPENHPNKKDLEGEDPDQEALQAKIRVLEERLNNKKEALLEKELVYEEVSNLAEKLRTQALDGRKTTLEIAEKINEYKARTTELSRSMLATVSELSMFQSKALKLQQEKEEKEQILETALVQLDQGLPPTVDADREWDRLERNRERRSQESEERMQRKILESQLTPNGVKTSALPRPGLYMPADIQIPRPYGMFAPFNPSEPGAQMRHIVKPKIKEIEY